MVLGVKIKDNKTGLFRLKDGRYSKNGKTYSNLRFAKSSVTNDISFRLNSIKNYFNCDFIIFNDDCTIEKISVISHIIEVIKREIKRTSQNLPNDPENYWFKYYDKKIKNLKQILIELEKEGI